MFLEANLKCLTWLKPASYIVMSVSLLISTRRVANRLIDNSNQSKGVQHWAKFCQLIASLSVVLPQHNLPKLKLEYLKSILKVRGRWQPLRGLPIINLKRWNECLPPGRSYGMVKGSTLSLGRTRVSPSRTRSTAIFRHVNKVCWNKNLQLLHHTTMLKVKYLGLAEVLALQEFRL